VLTIPMMDARTLLCEWAVAGYRATGHYLVAIDDKGLLSASGLQDDPGLYLFIPWIVNVTGWSVPKAIAAFQWSLILISAAIALVCTWKLFRTTVQRLTVTIAILLSIALEIFSGDIYLLPVALVLAVVPLSLVLLGTTRVHLILTAMVLIGFIAAFFDFTRSQSATGVLLFLLVLIVTSKVSRRVRIQWAVGLLAAFFIGIGVTRVMILRRNTFLASRVTNFQARPIRHPMWDHVYIGFGFLTNPYVAAYRDDVAASAMRAINPTMDPWGPGAEAVFRREVIRLAVAHPFFVVRTMVAKLGVLAFYLFLAGGFLVMWRSRKRQSNSLDAAFAIGIGFYLLPGIFMIPTVQYVAGAISFMLLYSAVRLANGRDHLWP
jgi:hypothetical protein